MYDSPPMVKEIIGIRDKGLGTRQLSRCGVILVFLFKPEGMIIILPTARLILVFFFQSRRADKDLAGDEAKRNPRTGIKKISPEGAAEILYFM